MSEKGTNDNPQDIPAGGYVNFPNTSYSYGTIQRIVGNNHQFVLPPNGYFKVIFSVVVQNTGELVVVLNGQELLYTVCGKSGNGEIVGVSIIKTPLTTTNISPINFSTLSINNVISAHSGLHIDNASGDLSQPLSCHLIIQQLQ